MPRGDEDKLVFQPFLSWLRANGWSVVGINPGSNSGPDIVATSPGGTKYIFEVKNHRTSTPSGANPENTDMWTALGQIVTRMGDVDARFGIVVPLSAKEWFERNLPLRICELMRLSVFLVSHSHENVDVINYP